MLQLEEGVVQLGAVGAVRQLHGLCVLGCPCLLLHALGVASSESPKCGMGGDSIMQAILSSCTLPSVLKARKLCVKTNGFPGRLHHAPSAGRRTR